MQQVAHDPGARPPIRITLDGADLRTRNMELASLIDWLREDPQIGPHALISVIGARSLPRGTMGNLAVIQLVVDTAFQTAGLVVAVMAWRSTLRARSALTVEQDGQEPQAVPPAETGKD